MTLRVAELFGPTLQGEGPHTGHLSAFLRLSGCNLSCAWCDTPYTWDWTRFTESDEARDMEPDEIATRIHAMRVERVVLTGGEPLVQQKHLVPTLAALAPLPVDVETNGTIAPTGEVAALVDTFVVSPKVIPSAAQQLSQAIKPHALNRFRELAAEGRAVFKYVARDKADLDALRYHSETQALSPVYVMPEGRTADEVVASTRRIADDVVANGWRLTSRLHVLAWGDERGR